MYNVFLRLIYKKQKRKHVYTFKVIFSIVFLVETLKPRWKNKLDGFTRCLKKTKDNQRSGSGNTKIPICKFFKELEFLGEK